MPLRNGWRGRDRAASASSDDNDDNDGGSSSGEELLDMYHDAVELARLYRDTTDEAEVGLVAGVRSSRDTSIEIVVDEGPVVLASQALPSLLVAAVGSAVTGWLFGIVQTWAVFEDTPQFFILVPILFNLKGNLEMNLASRLSTAANLGLLGRASSRWKVIIGNLALLQVQAFGVGTFAGIQSIVLGSIEHNIWNDFSKALFIVTSSVSTAAVASFALGSLMCMLVVTCYLCRINPDNVATPLAASLGDLATLVILAVLGSALYFSLDTYSVPIIAIIQLLVLPLWIHLTYSNEHVQSVLVDGWLPLLAAMLISSGAGILLESSLSKFAGLAVVIPVVNGVGGNIGSIYASRRSTFLHAGVSENHRKSMLALFLLSMPLLLLFMTCVYTLGIGHVHVTPLFIIFVLVIGLIQVSTLLFLAHHMVRLFWRNELEPDDFVIPLLSALGDVIGTGLLIGAYYILVAVGDREMLPQIPPTSSGSS